MESEAINICLLYTSWEILRRKGTTYYGIATTATGIIKCILHDDNRILPVSTLLEGEYPSLIHI